ncbi:MAG: Endonuclease 4 [Candidatus Anoxychlamydiales bacterium]|nr:Endonuclease 4 [Candidatus Anoxychlamydiales bacterium]NGX52646.1 Endonuclease 4 [Candidatus Anoxychlamydiales bacterium]
MEKEKTLVGAHTSIAGGIFNAIYEANRIGANTFQIFTANQRQWKAKPISEEDAKKFKEAKKENNIKKVISHNSYLINLGSPKKESLDLSRKTFLEEIKRCHALEIDYLVFHPGSALTSTEEESLDTISESILSFESEVKKGKTKLLLETTAGQGSNVGYKFEHLDYVIKKVKHKIPIGVCLDTCHIFSAGYDIRTKKAFDNTFEKFDSVIGLKYLNAFHVNDSKVDFESRKDRHESLGKGKIGIDAFKFLMKDKRFKSIPKILETPNDEIWKDEIEILKKFAGFLI